MNIAGAVRGLDSAVPALTEMKERGARRAPPKAAKLLLPVWGFGFVRQFLDVGLRTLLAPGNIPAMASMLPCEFVILTREEDEPYFLSHPAFEALRKVCPTEIRLIDDLITGTNYSTTLTLAYTAAVRAEGPALVDTCFFFLVSDYIMADGSLGNVMQRMMNGASAVLVGNFQVTAESALPWLQEQLNFATPALPLPPRELMRWGLAHLHPVTIANTVNYPLNHNRHTNRLFWRVDGETLLGRFYLMHMITVRPENSEFIVGAACDYSFIPEMCPSGNVEVITDSDDYLVIEMQSRRHEANFLRPGPLQPRVLGKTLSEWTTEAHRDNARHSVIFHAGGRPTTLPSIIAESDRFIGQVHQALRRAKPHRNHPYWRGALAAQHEATGRRLGLREQWMALGLPPHVVEEFERRLGEGLFEQLGLFLFGLPPAVRKWHPRAPDYAPILKKLSTFADNASLKLLLVSDAPNVFTVSLPDDGYRVVRLRRSPFLESQQETFETLHGSFDICAVELAEEELTIGGELVDRLLPLMRPDGLILVSIYNRRAQARPGFAATMSFDGSSLLRPGAVLEELFVVPASPIRSFFSRALIRTMHLGYRTPTLGLPVFGLTGWFLALGSWISNVVDTRRKMSRIRPGQLATSFHMALRVSPGIQDSWRYAARRQLRRKHRRRMGIEDRPLRYHASGRPSDTAAILAGGRPPVINDPDTMTTSNVTERTPLPAAGAMPKEPSSMNETTREPQYSRCVEVKNEIGLTTLGLMTNQVWHDDPRRLMILLSRYKFVAKMLSGRKNVGELGCGDAFGSRVVLQELEKLTVYDFDPVFIEDVRQRYSPKWPLEARVHDILAAPLPQVHDAIYSLDVIEHIARHDEHGYLTNLSRSLNEHGVLIIGSPSLESQPYASPQSKAGHINCKTGSEMKALLQNYFSTVFLFSMNDEVVHTGFYPMAHYLLAVCCGPKSGAQSGS
jgi:hypothetical protein